MKSNYPLLIPPIIFAAIFSYLMVRDYKRFHVHAQPVEVESEFVLVTKRIEIQVYDALGRKSYTTTQGIYVMQHRITHACWIGASVPPDAHIVSWSPAPSGVCK